MKKIDGYMCEYCGEILDKETDALECEKSHVDIKQLKIVSGSFKDRITTIRDSFFGNDKKLDNNVFIPHRIEVRYKEKERISFFEKSFIAHYELIKYEYKAL